MLMCGGGTGGHVYPALAVVEALRKRFGDGLAVCYAGAPDSVEERLAGQWEIPFRAVESGGLRGRGPVDAARSLVRFRRGVRQARGFLKECRPQVVFSTGGYASAPVLLAARRTRVPAMIYLPDIEPGLTVKWLSRLVDRVAVSFEEVQRHFPAGKSVVSGYPVREALQGRDEQTARRRLGLAPEGLVVLAFGGSQGARSINRAMVEGIERLLSEAEVVHLTGGLDYDWVMDAREGLMPQLRERYHVHRYLDDEMGDALAAADVVVARAGASTLGEFPAAGVPAVLVPYPYAGGHQYANARYLADRGAAVIVEDKELSGRLVPTLLELLHDGARREHMAERARAVARPDAAMRLAEELEKLAAGRGA